MSHSFNFFRRFHDLLYETSSRLRRSPPQPSLTIQPSGISQYLYRLYSSALMRTFVDSKAFKVLKNTKHKISTIVSCHIFHVTNFWKRVDCEKVERKFVIFMEFHCCVPTPRSSFSVIRKIARVFEEWNCPRERARKLIPGTCLARWGTHTCRLFFSIIISLCHIQILRFIYNSKIILILITDFQRSRIIYLCCNFCKSNYLNESI